jgi:hypothetical protein
LSVASLACPTRRPDISVIRFKGPGRMDLVP